MRRSDKNLDVINNFILDVTHQNEQDDDNTLHVHRSQDLYKIAKDYIEHDHVDGKGNPYDEGMTREDVAEANEHIQFLSEDEMDEAIMGVAQGFGSEPTVAYSVPKILQILQKRDGMTYDEAREFFEFNIIGAYVGETMPVFIYME